MATISASIPKVARYELPANTCPVIDKAISNLEEIRSANETLRDAAIAYLRDNRTFAETCKKFQVENDRLEKENKELQLTKERLEQISSGAISVDAKKVIALETELLNYKQIEIILEDVLRIAFKKISKSTFLSLVQGSTKNYLKKTEDARKQALDAIRRNAILKLSKEEQQVLNINSLDDDDEEEEG